jgi:hypothetical protein
LARHENLDTKKYKRQINYTTFPIASFDLTKEEEKKQIGDEVKECNAMHVVLMIQN